MKAELRIIVENGRVTDMNNSLANHNDIEMVHKLFHLLFGPDPINGTSPKLPPDVSDEEYNEAIDHAKGVIEQYGDEILGEPDPPKPPPPPKPIKLSQDPELRDFVDTIKDKKPRTIIKECQEKFGREPSLASVNSYKMNPKKS